MFLNDKSIDKKYEMACDICYLYLYCNINFMILMTLTINAVYSTR